MAGILGGTLFGLYMVDQCRFTVNPGHTALMFNRFGGLSDRLYREGWHLRIPYFQVPIIYNIQTNLKQIPASTANKDMQNVILKLRVLYRPDQSNLPSLYRYCGLNYDDRVLPSIANEVLRSVIAQYTASQLMSQRDQVSNKIRRSLQQRAAQFYIVIDDVSISELTFGREYLQSIEAKQIAQQEAERAKYIVEQARNQKKSIIIKAQAEAQSIKLVGEAATNNPSYLDVRRIEYAKEIAQILSETRNHIMLNSDLLMMDTKQRPLGQSL
ncbi:hypothetical protein PPERSA_11252 [Pseudocohnilembus persalinus]|uniref:Prohibitin n=1 Tax=Pseudocohnilembus persalinus TaxID=266149 RepID=A0A0V0QZH0_PSEPJ|nr:hypothetical protein PPERSA_11252 [Pseudocohnilembus persalinus]|eukprot:KRX07703.1 hypothetical protein PPERSA_11252 [Pseudocohnilembus persalinus]